MADGPANAEAVQALPPTTPAFLGCPTVGAINVELMRQRNKTTGPDALIIDRDSPDIARSQGFMGIVPAAQMGIKANNWPTTGVHSCRARGVDGERTKNPNEARENSAARNQALSAPSGSLRGNG